MASNESATRTDETIGVFLLCFAWLANVGLTF